ncbi:MAG: TatD family deoxyribonuclease [Phycisphaerales bacterium]|nr:MAG: TatD family deoxyribonuclease [Phycisphaerales bacterium]
MVRSSPAALSTLSVSTTSRTTIAPRAIRRRISEAMRTSPSGVVSSTLFIHPACSPIMRTTYHRSSTPAPAAAPNTHNAATDANAMQRAACSNFDPVRTKGSLSTVQKESSRAAFHFRPCVGPYRPSPSDAAAGPGFPDYPPRLMLDTHCHLTFPDYEGAVDRVLADAAAAGVTGAITISTTTQDCIEALAIAASHENVWCSAGVHPLYADRTPHKWGNLKHVARHEKCVAWGELGLDNHYTNPPRELQRSVLEEQLAFIESCAREGIDLPVILHCREAFKDLIPVLEATTLDPARFVFHCFTGAPDDMRMLLDFGAHVSFTGVVTYPNAPEVREAALLAPLDRIMLETDAPFLTPAPHRGVRPNAPKYARVTAEFLANLRGERWDDFHAQINENTSRFFGIQNVR